MWRVIGQERAVTMLRQTLERGKVAHAYLFTGPRCVGKTTLALELAKALNCEADEPPCGECVSCRKIDRRQHADVQVIGLNDDNNGNGENKQTEISIEQIRRLQHSASLPPFEGRYRVFIIEGTEFMSVEAANCLLKTLEEPEERVVFVLLTARRSFIPETVISRCQWLKLTTVSAGEIEKELNEMRGVELEKARLLARLCRGCVGWAISAAESDDFLARYYEVRDRIKEIMLAGNEERFTYAAQLATMFSQKRDDVQEALCLWLDMWRDMLLVKTGLGEAITNIDLENELGQMVEEYSIGDIRSFIGAIQKAAEQLRQNANPRLALEVLMLDMPGARRERVAG